MTCNRCQGHGKIRIQKGFFTETVACPKCSDNGNASDICPEKEAIEKLNQLRQELAQHTRDMTEKGYKID